MKALVNGKPVEAPEGATVAAALALAGVSAFRQSVTGEPRGPVCGMGICFECRVTIDGRPHARSCQEPCREGMEIETGEGPLPYGRGPDEQQSRDRQGAVSYDILIVGAGPAGLTAARRAAECGASVAVVDDNPAPGGQIWRGQRIPAAGAIYSSILPNPKLILGARVVAAPAPGRLTIEASGAAFEIEYRSLILATGARERFLPFPGWTLPHVAGAGGLQALVKSGMPVAGKRVVVAGSGPLLLAVADYLRRHGARVVLVAEQARLSSLAGFTLALAGHPARLLQAASLRGGIRYLTGCWPIAAEPGAVTLRQGRRTWTERCDYLACGFGLVPNTELAMLLRCGTEVDEFQQTAAAGIYAAGEITGIGGLELAQVEGEIAGYAATGRHDRARALFASRARQRRFAAALERAFALREELRSPAADDTIVCRCEDVTLGRLRRYGNWREAKLQTRCGMGACQGRVCGAAAEFLLGWKPDSVRPPLFPARLGTLL